MSLGKFLFSAVSSVRNLIPLQQVQPCRNYHAITLGYNKFPNVGLSLDSDTNMWNSVRTKIRNYWPRPNEVKRVRRHGWVYRMSTHEGRKVLMRRILRGRYVLSH